ncbi:unnamed protein product [Vicia faba]|uniref:Flagellar FliJ protein n=1 Tax=Vicia faba TaxID=3906 RepID=A0AAV1ARL8_VICFA|nr:unnamed protein product [Vicia faba]
MLFFSSQCQVARFYETKLKIRVYTFSYLSLSAFYLRFIPYQGIRMSHLSYSSAKNSSGHSHYHLLRRVPRRRCSSAHIVGTCNNLSLAYDVKDLLFEEGIEVLSKKRTENLKKIEGLLAVNLERKRIRPDLVLRLQIEEKMLRLLDLQTRLRDEIDQQQQEIMAMPDRPYRKFVRLCERQRVELVRQVQASQKAAREKQLKSIFLWRKKLLEAHWAIRDVRTARNRGVAKYHERMLREFSKHKGDEQ